MNCHMTYVTLNPLLSSEGSLFACSEPSCDLSEAPMTEPFGGSFPVTMSFMTAVTCSPTGGQPGTKAIVIS